MVLESIVRRRAVREFSDEPVLDESIEDIIKAAQFAPTATGKKEVEFVVVKDQVVKDKLFGILQQDFVAKAPVLIVPVSYSKAAVLPQTDLAIASAFMMIQAAELGLGTVWKHIDPEQSKRVCQVLGLPSDYTLVNLIPVGYPLNELPDHGDADFSPSKIHKNIF
jgi:nitroreductase